jgi:hypothetical protein
MCMYNMSDLRHPPILSHPISENKNGSSIGGAEEIGVSKFGLVLKTKVPQVAHKNCT